MGVALKDLTDSCKEEISYEVLKGKIIAVDAFNALYQFLAAIRQPDGTPLIDSHGNITSHLSGLFYRSVSLLERGIRLVYVFDGEKPTFKGKEIEKRRERRKEFEEKWKEKLEEGNLMEAKKYAQGSSFLTEEMVEEAKELIKAMGLCYVDAPSEGEAEAAYLAKKGVVYGAGSQDYDALLFGSPLLIRNLAISGKRKIPGSFQHVEVKPEMISLPILLEKYKITYDQLICLGILVGTDYAENGVEGVGVKKALEIVRVYRTPEKIYSAIKDKWKHDVEFLEIFEFFKNPPVKDVEISFGRVDEGAIFSLLVERHDFSEERVSHAIDRLKKGKSFSAQKTLF